MLSAFINSFKVEELRKRLLFTFGVVFVCRLVSIVPTPGVDATQLQALVQNISNQVGGGILGLVDLFSGGAMSNCAIGALGIMPYISASIILQLMTAVTPALERLAREGDVGRQKITQYTRYLTVVICIIQGYAMAVALQNPSYLFGRDLGTIVNMDYVWGFRILTVITMTTGTVIMMWLGEQITQSGVGNGISLIITVNIISRLPGAVQAMIRMFRPMAGGEAQFSVFHLVGLLLMMFLVVAGTVAVTQATRKIPIQYAKRVIGRKIYGGQSTYMPLRVNYSGVMPIIFASAILMFPQKILQMLPGEFFQNLAASFAMDRGLYMTLYALMILFFSYFWVATVFNPVQIADDLKKAGGYVPGIRPGTSTAEFLDRTMTRITLAGAMFLTIIAVIPTIMARQFNIPWIVASFFGGTSLLIIVGVMLDTMRQVESHLIMRHYDGFLKKGHLRGRR
ncbi:MAG: preprotein translocase subunit SecY [Verrucomicrobia bacterium]|nr:preprotein translocase subunit SecY [Verrucomicrobiota bacterium]MCG2678996.1 preprotein translocase subunit SecY [Kiritimatiellia bacterium]MBU4248348.1 preprotein translocase subunit SecY [Verrucomicrobiota bacterium]MBU4289733.1 preprotein translocase subunit SecY [Verrucomicrobiota bacterium]MBU4428553.1 preprotein translocase subunit SecY [Verrucomicrobiota bacterium]